MERITTIYSACGMDVISRERVMEQIDQETFDDLVSLECEHDREIVLKGQMIYVYKTVYVDTIAHDDGLIDLDIDVLK